MCLSDQGKVDEARAVAAEAAAKMNPFPADDQNPLAGNVNHDRLIVWLACRQAQALLQPAAATDGPPPG